MPHQVAFKSVRASVSYLARHVCLTPLPRYRAASAGIISCSDDLNELSRPCFKLRYLDRASRFFDFSRLGIFRSITMDSDNEDEEPPAPLPPQLKSPTNWAVAFGIITFLLDCCMLTVSIMAYTGAAPPKKDETNPLKTTWITWTTRARQIQAAEISMVYSSQSSSYQTH